MIRMKAATVKQESVHRLIVRGIVMPTGPLEVLPLGSGERRHPLVRNLVEKDVDGLLRADTRIDLTALSAEPERAEEFGDVP